MHARELVLLHGQPGSQADWLGVVELLPAAARAVAVDRPGYGVSRRAPGGFRAGALDVLDGLDARGTARAVLVGHSYGGGVALATAIMAPERVEALVLVSSVGPECLTPADHLLAAPVVGEVMSLFAFALTPPLVRAGLAVAERRRHRPLRAHEHPSLQVWGRTPSDHGQVWRSFLVEQRALVDELDDLAAAVAAVDVPTLLVADPDDSVVPVRTSRALAAALPDSELILVSGAGHHIPRRRPAELADAIGRFLTSLDETGPGGTTLVEPVLGENGLVETDLVETGLVETGLVETGLVETGLVETGLVETGLEDDPRRADPASA